MSTSSEAHGRATRWALHSKHPNRLEDYSIIADSTRGRDIKELGQLIRRSLPGSPRSTDSGPDGLPWVTFAGSGGYAAPRERIGVSIMDWEHAGARDATGRPIAETRYFDFEFAGNGGPQPGYRELYAAVTDLELPGGEVVVPLPPANLEHLAEDIDSLGFEWVASLAALLLDQPVMIAAVPVPSLDERVRCLDAVATLLPYGFRADLVAGTWTPNLANHEIRLAFADRVKTQQHQVGWCVVPDLTPLTGLVPRYLRHLLDLRERVDTRQLVERLWCGTRPLPPGADGAATALRYLELQDRPYSTMVRYQDGVASPGEARTVLAETDAAALEAGVRRELLRRLAVEATDADLTMLERLWSAEILPILVELAVDAPAELLQRYADVVERGGELPEFRLGLVAAVGDDLSPDRRGRVARFLATSAPPTDEPRLRAALHGNPALCADVVTAVVESGPERFVPWLRWLTGQASHRWLQPFAVAVQAGTLLAPGDAVALTPWGARMIIAALTAARACGTLPAVLPGLWPELLRAVDHGPARQAVTALLAELPAQPVGIQGLIDLILAVWEERPAQRGAAEDPATYAGTVADQLRSWLPTQRRRTVALRLIRDLTASSSRPDGLALAIALSERLLTDPVYDDIAGGLLPAIEAAPQTLRTLSAPLRQALLRMSPPLRSRDLLDRLSDAVTAGIDEEGVVELWSEGVRRGCRPDEVVLTLRPWLGMAQPAGIFTVIEGLLYRLVATGYPDVVAVVQGAHGAVLAGGLGAELAAEYRAHLRAVGHPLHLHSTALNRALAASTGGAPLKRILRYQRRRRR